jgi:hypothetical protein
MRGGYVHGHDTTRPSFGIKSEHRLKTNNNYLNAVIAALLFHIS